MGGHKTGGWSKTGGPVSPRPGAKTATACAAGQAVKFHFYNL